MKKTYQFTFLPILAFALLLSVASCKNESKPQLVEEPTVETVPQEVINIIDLNEMEAKAIANFKDGDGEVYMKMFTDGETKVMLCTIPSGSSVGYHTHDNNMEVILVQQGTATIAFDGVEQNYTVGQVHYCPKGHGHSISNKAEEDLVIYNVVSLQ